MIRHTISGPKNTFSSYGQELAKAQAVVDKAFKSKNQQLIKYLLSVAKLKIRGDNFFATKIKKLTDRARIKEGVLMEQTRRINLYINNQDRQALRELIDKATNVLEVLEVNENAV